MSTNYKEYKFSDLIEEVEERNTSLEYGLDDIVGVTIEKRMIPTIANLTQTALDKFYIVKPDTFVYNPRTHGVRLGMGYNDTNKTFLTSWNNVAFRVKEDAKRIVLSKYLWIYFNRPEWDRQTNFMAWGSSTIVFAWNDFLSIKIKLPDLKEQEKIVNTYNAITKRIQLKQKINENLEKTAEVIYKNSLTTKKTSISSFGKECNITTGKLNSEDATIDGEYPFFTCSQETYKTNTFAFDQEAVLLAGNNASAIYPLKIYKGKFNAYQRTYVISSNNHLISNYQIYFDLKNKLEEFKGLSFGTTTKFLTMTILNPIELHIFSEKDSYELTNQLKNCFDEITLIQKELIKLDNLKQLVISRISGM